MEEFFYRPIVPIGDIGIYPNREEQEERIQFYIGSSSEEENEPPNPFVRPPIPRAIRRWQARRPPTPHPIRRWEARRNLVVQPPREEIELPVLNGHREEIEPVVINERQEEIEIGPPVLNGYHDASPSPPPLYVPHERRPRYREHHF